MTYLNNFQQNLDNDVMNICKQVKSNSELEVSFTTSPLKSYSDNNEQYIGKKKAERAEDLKIYKVGNQLI